MATNALTTKPAGIEFYGGYQVYSDSGIDLTLLHSQLQRPIEERIDGNCRFLHFIYALQESARHESPWRTDLLRPPMLNAEPLLRLLAQNNVEFVVIGGIAMTAHGSAHITNDLDVCYRRTDANMSALAAGLATAHPYLRGAPPGLPFRFDLPTIKAGLNFTLDTDLGPLDVLGEVGGVGSYDEALRESQIKEMYGLKVNVLSIDGLIASKKAADRIKDRNHVLELIELKKMLESKSKGN